MTSFTIKHLNEKTSIVEYTGHEHIVILPDEYETQPITCIGAKAFLSRKNIVELTLPLYLTDIEAWAFAHMKNLTTLTVPCMPITLGKDVFLDCPKLTAIHIQNDTSDNPGTAFFLADAIIRLQALSLFTPDKAGDATLHTTWIAQYDEALRSFVEQPDDVGFQPVFYGWFNDEDAEVTQRPAYIKAQREAKTNMVLTRLLYPKHLSDTDKQFFSNYLASQMPSDDNAYTPKELEQVTVWHLYRTQYLQDIRYLDVLLEAGCCHAGNISYLIQDIKDSNPEVTAKLLNYQMEQQNEHDSFEEFEL